MFLTQRKPHNTIYTRASRLPPACDSVYAEYLGEDWSVLVNRQAVMPLVFKDLESPIAFYWKDEEHWKVKALTLVSDTPKHGVINALKFVAVANDGSEVTLIDANGLELVSHSRTEGFTFDCDSSNVAFYHSYRLYLTGSRPNGEDLGSLISVSFMLGEKDVQPQ